MKGPIALAVYSVQPKGLDGVVDGSAASSGEPANRLHQIDQQAVNTIVNGSGSPPRPWAGLRQIQTGAAGIVRHLPVRRHCGPSLVC